MFPLVVAGTPPGARSQASVQACISPREPVGRIVIAVEGEQRLGGNQVRLQDVSGGRAGHARDFLGLPEAVLEVSPAQREAREQEPDRPLVPATRLPAEAAVHIRRLSEVLLGAVPGASHQVNLGERIEDGAGRLVELERAPDGQRAVQDVLGEFEVSLAHADLPERGQRDGKAVRGPGRFMEGHGAVGQRAGLFELVAHQRDDCLVAAHQREHVIGLRERREVFGLAEGAGGLLVAAALGEDRPRQRVDQREVASLAGGMQGGGRRVDVVADDGELADLLVADAEFVVRQADGARVVRQFRLLQGAAEQRDGARLVGPKKRHAAMEPPQRREAHRFDALAQDIGRPAKRCAGLLEVILQEPRFGERGANRELVVAAQRR